MAKQTRSFAVIGLGTFGSTVARELARFDNEVIGVDSNEKLVASHAQDLTQALILDAREDGALREAGLETVDVGIVAIGTDMEASILSVINLKTLGVETIWAKATSKNHHRILSKIGVDRVIHPEKEVGQHIAQVLHNPLVRDYVSLGNGQHVVPLDGAAALSRLVEKGAAQPACDAGHDLCQFHLDRRGRAEPAIQPYRRGHVQRRALHRRLRCHRDGAGGCRHRDRFHAYRPDHRGAAHSFGWAQGVWQALFHAISAFNNAGFSLFSDSLSGYVADPVVNITIAFLFIIGGLGFVVLADLNTQRRWAKLTLHSKLMLSGTAFLILASWGLFAALEWRNPATLGALEGTGPRLLASWFQAVTPRTAGFNTLDYASMTDSTTIMTLGLMLVGGGSSSTAGGIKVTTLIVLVLATLAFFRRQERLHIFGRSLGISEVMKVLALTALSIFLVLTGLFLVSLTYQGAFIDLVFEVFSAFGTVGLSRGATSELDTFSRLIIIAIMFVGRLGPLTLAFFLATRSTPKVRYPEGKVYLG